MVWFSNDSNKNDNSQEAMVASNRKWVGLARLLSCCGVFNHHTDNTGLSILTEEEKEGRPNSLIKLHQDLQTSSPINDVHNLVLWSTGDSLKFKFQKLDLDIIYNLYYFCSCNVRRLYPGIWHWGDALGCAVVLVYRRLAEVPCLTQLPKALTWLPLVINKNMHRCRTCTALT